MNDITLAVDVMGGDLGPRVIIPAIAQALQKNSNLTFLLFGNQHQAIPLLQKYTLQNHPKIQFHHTEQVIDADISFSKTIRQSKNSSMRLALEAVKEGKAQGCVSGGNTGALMGLAKLLIAPLPNIERPALTSLIPAMNGKSTVMLDLGANIEVSDYQLQQFAEMGNLFAQVMLGLVYPRISLLNIGTEENKGTAQLQAVHQQLKNRQDLNYIGFIESDKLTSYLTDVIICDGYTGNIALKALEGAAKNIIALFKKEKADSNICRSTKRYLLKLIFYRYYRKLQEINPDRHNGATLLGLSKVVVKSHGGANSNAFCYAIDYAIQQIEGDIPSRIMQGLSQLE